MMKVHTDINALPHFRNAVVTIGTFDGVHLGHCQIIHQLKKEAIAISGETVIITFHPHPRKIIPGKSSIYLLNTLDEKIYLLEKLGINHLVVVPFTETFANQTASEYVEDFLIKNFNPHTLIIGYDHRFGQGRKGDFHLLEEYAAAYRFNLIEIPQHLLNESAISSTRIREDLLNGNCGQANELLGYDYFFEGKVVQGNQLGRTIGYATANLQVREAEKLIPANGVYAVTVEVPVKQHANSGGSQVHKGMMNIGVRPTIDGINRVIEVHLFDFDQNIYGETIRILLKKFLRPEQKFSGLDALQQQLATDKQQALEVLV